MRSRHRVCTVILFTRVTRVECLKVARLSTRCYTQQILGSTFCVHEQSEGSALHMAHAARTKCLHMLLFVHVFRILRFY